MHRIPALRRVVPEGYSVCMLHLEGVTPLLMSSPEADRSSDTYLAYRTLSRKRGKTVADEDRLRELEWHTRLYYDAEVGAYIPGANIHEMLRAAATKIRKGEDIKRSLIVPDYRVPLTYEGPRTPEEMWADGGFAYTTMVANAGAGSGRVERTRPIFEPWSITTEVAFDPEDLDMDDVEFAVNRAQKYGLGDRRPTFGGFLSSLTFRHRAIAPANADGAKPRDKVAEQVAKTRAENVK